MLKKSLCAAGLLLLAATASAATGDDDDKKKKGETTEERLATLEEEVARMRAEKDADGTLRASFSGGKLKFQSADGNFTAQLGGRIHFDLGGVNEDQAWRNSVGGAQPDGAEIRRGRFYLAGTVNKAFDYKWQIEFAGSTAPLFKDFYVAAKDSPVGRIQGGQFKENFGIEQLTSSNNLSTMERSAASEAFSRGRNIGVMVTDHTESELLQWSVAVFKEDGADTGMSFNSGDANFTGRLSAAPINKNDGRDVLHVGAQFRKAGDFNGMLRYRARGSGTHLLTARAVDTGFIAANGADEAGVETAWVRGPFSAQAEYMRATIDAKQGMSNPTFYAWYGLISYFLTGESRNYKASSGSFSSIVPRKTGGACSGAWELAARYSYIDLDDESVAGGKLADVTLGLNWYLNRNTRILLNWSQGELQGSRNGTADTVQLRWQLAF